MNIFYIPNPTKYLNLTTLLTIIKAKAVVNGLLIARIGP